MNTKTNVLIASPGERWKSYRAERKACKRKFSEEAVHDFRVATRRLLAVMDMLRILDPHSHTPKARRILKDQLDSLNALRDTQVTLADISAQVANGADIKPFEEYLLARERKLLRTARKEIKDLPVSKLGRYIRKCRLALEENAKAGSWTARTLSAVDQAYARAMQAFGQVEASQSATIHHFRVTFKKFRYMAEMVNPVLKGSPKTYLKQMHEYQGLMGDVQDVEVILAALAEYAGQVDTSIPAEVFERFENQRAALIAKFMKGRNKFHLFWRSAPDQKFIWEKNNESVHRSPRHRGGARNA